jgi:hypothetical protein
MHAESCPLSISWVSHSRLTREKVRDTPRGRRL